MHDRPLIHLGYPKTGTTTLQEHLFRGHEEIVAFQQPDQRKDPATHAILRALLESGRTDFSRARAAIERCNGANKRLVVSDEALTFGEFMSRSSVYPIRSDHSATAERIRSLFGEAKIVVFVRNQANLAVSFQRQLMKRGLESPRPVCEYLDSMNARTDGRMSKALDYEAMYDAYCAVFGPTHVHVFVYENWVSDFGAAAKALAVIAGVDPDLAVSLVRGHNKNVTKSGYTEFRQYPAVSKRTIRRLNGARKKLARFLPRSAARVLRQALLVDREYPAVDKASRERIVAEYAASNRRLFDRLGIDGEALGYW
ncbi:sulfotransferase [Spiribacter sp. 218]|uniref:sulfotransferase n=1 Tax=Spiribacter pallidus TaxID=1987936 RepID=UPI00349F7290